MQVKIKRLHSRAQLPSYQTAGAAAMDIEACLDQPVTIKPNQRRVIPAGFAIELPQGYEAQIRARSGLSLKHGIALANGVGTIDSDYRGEIGAILINLSDEPFEIMPGMRIAQMVIAKHETIDWQEVDDLAESQRGTGGYGSTKH